jgi:hypothetical protein
MAYHPLQTGRLSWSKLVGCTRRAALIHVEINDRQNQKLQSDFNKLCCGDYHHRIVYKSDLTSNTYTPTGRILVHEDDVFFDTPGHEAFVDAHSNEHNDTDMDIEAATDHCVFRANANCYVCSANADPDMDTHPGHHGPRKVLETPRDYDALHPRFAWLPTNIIKKTFEVTTQYAQMPLNTVLCKHFKSPNPVVNV